LSYCKWHPNFSMNTPTQKLVTYAYYDITDEEGLLRLFEAKPSGIWRITIGIDDHTDDNTIFEALTVLRSLSSIGHTMEEIKANKEWLRQKIECDECSLKLENRDTSIPSGSVQVAEE
jgi:hypothetical protein